jgi:flagellar biogenesis protein FliO
MHLHRKASPRTALPVWIVLGSGFLCGAAFAAQPQAATPVAAMTPATTSIWAAPAADPAPASAEVPAPLPSAEVPAPPPVDPATLPLPAAAPATAPLVAPVVTPPAAQPAAAVAAAPAPVLPTLTGARPPAPAPAPSAWTPAGSSGQPEPLTGAPPVDLGRSLRNLLLLASVLVLAGAVWVFLRDRRGQRRPQNANPLELIASVKLGGRWPVSLVRVPGRLLVVGATDSGVALLTELEDDLDDEVVSEADGYDDGDDRYARDLAEYDAPRRGPATRPDLNEGPDPTYRRPVRRAASTRPAHRGGTEPEGDAFLEQLLGRLAENRGAVMRASAPADERTALRQRLQTLRRGPTAL